MLPLNALMHKFSTIKQWIAYGYYQFYLNICSFMNRYQWNYCTIGDYMYEALGKNELGYFDCHKDKYGHNINVLRLLDTPSDKTISLQIECLLG